MLKYPFLDNKSRYFYFSKEVFLAKKICVQKIFAGLAGLCIKKALNWYNILQSKGLVSKEEPKVENAESIKEQVVEEVKEKKKKTTKKE